MTGFPPPDPPMSLDEARTILIEHQRWRRCEVDRERYNYRQIGRALDVLIAATGPRPSPEHVL